MGVLLWGEDKAISQQARGHGLPVALLNGALLPFERALVAAPGTTVPWHLVEAGFRFLEHWEAAAPLSERDLAEDLGRAEERRQTAGLLRDLRVPVYACELLFVRDCDGGRALLAAWQEEMGRGDTGTRGRGDAGRLAFLRALYRVKPLFLALPRSWLLKETSAPVVARPTPAHKSDLVHVEIAPGRYVCCKPDEVEKYRERFARMRARRRC